MSCNMNFPYLCTQWWYAHLLMQEVTAPMANAAYQTNLPASAISILEFMHPNKHHPHMSWLEPSRETNTLTCMHTSWPRGPWLGNTSQAGQVQGNKHTLRICCACSLATSCRSYAHAACGGPGGLQFPENLRAQ